METALQPPPDARWPDGFHPTRVDEKGRMRLPAKMLESWERSGKPEFFVTTFDERIARLYFMHVWHQVKDALQAKRGEASAKSIFLFANYYGEASTVDPQGRILMPTNLRRKLEFESQPVQMLGAGQRIDVYSDSALQQQMALARPTLTSAVDDLDVWGIG